MMPSAWNDSGINWDDLSRTSPRDAIRELYIAVNERDYWVRHFGSGGYATLAELEPIDYDATKRHRTKSQIDFIVNALSNWLSDSSAPTQEGSLDYAKGGYKGSFIDYSSGSNYEYVNYGNDSDFTTDYYAPNLVSGIRGNTLIEEIQLGYDSFNKKEMGNLESQLNVDLSFIRAYDNHNSFRFTYQMMEAVFKVLNFLTYVRRCTYRNGGYSGKPAVMAISNFNTAYMIQGNDYVGSNTFEAQRDNLYNSVDCNSGQSIIFNPILSITGYNRDSTIVSPRWTMGYGGFNRACTFNEFNIVGLNGNTFKTDFFDHKSAIYNLDFAWDSFAKKSYKTTFSINSRPLGHTIRNNPFTQLIDETNGGSNGDINIDVDPNGTWVENSFGRVVDGEIDDSVENAPSYESSPGGDDAYGKFIEQNMPMINFNKEGFLKYYTE